MGKTKDQNNTVLAVLFIGVLMGALDIAIVGPALPSIRAFFGEQINERTLAWMFSVYVLFNLIGTPLMAKLSDVYGRKAIYVADVLLFAAGSLVVATAPAFWVVLIGRGIQGFGAGGIFPVASAVIGDTFPPEKRGSALGLIGAVFGLAFIIGPILGGLLLNLGWQWLFYINLPIAAVVIFLSLRNLPGKTVETSGRFDVAGMTVLTLTLASMTFGLNQIDTEHFGASLLSLSVLPFLLGAVVLGFILVQIEKRAENPILKPTLFAKRQLRLAYVLSAGAGIGESSLVFMPLLAVAAIPGMTSSKASYLMMSVVIAMSIGSPLVGKLLDRIGSRVIMIAGSFIFAGGVLLLSQFASILGLYLTAGALIGLGLSALLGAPGRYITLNETEPADRSVAQGVLTVFASVGQLVGSSTVGAVAASMGGGTVGYSTGFFVITFVGLAMVVAALALKSRDAEREAAQSNQTETKIQTMESNA